MADPALVKLSADLGAALRGRGWSLALAESCTGGWASEVVTMTPGSSSLFERGFITYSNDAKIEMLGVQAETLEKFGAVSEETATFPIRGWRLYRSAYSQSRETEKTLMMATL